MISIILADILLNTSKLFEVKESEIINNLHSSNGASHILWNYSTNGVVNSVAFSANGQYFVLGSSDNKIYLFNTFSSTPIWMYSTFGDVKTVAISSNGDFIAVGSTDNSVYFFNKLSSTPVWVYSTLGDVNSVAISSNGDFIAVGSADNNVYFFNKLSSTPLWSYETDDEASSIAMSSDGIYIATGSFDDNVYLFNKSSSIPIWNYTTNDDISSVAISSDGNYITAGSLDNNIYLFNKSSSYPVWNYSTNGDVNSISISSDGNYIVAGSYDESLYLFNKSSSVPLWNYSTNGNVKYVTISADGAYVVAGSDDEHIYFFNKSSSTPLWNYSTSTEVSSSTISSDGKYFISGGLNGNIILFYNFIFEDLILFTNTMSIDTKGTFELRWTPLEGIDNYSIYYYNKIITEINSSTTLLKSGITTNYYSVNRLNEGDYFFIIIAYNETGSYNSNNIFIKVRFDDVSNDLLFQIILLVLIFGSLLTVSSSVAYIYGKISKKRNFGLSEGEISYLIDEIIYNLPVIMEFIDSNKSIKELPKMKKIIVTIFSHEELMKIDSLDLPTEEKKHFLKEIINLNPEERKNLIDDMLEGQNL